MRPVLKSALRPVWRDATTLQLGVDPVHRVVLEHMAGPAETVLALLDGTRDTAAVVRTAAAAGVAPQDAVGLIDLLTAAGAVDDGGAALRLRSADRDRLAPEIAEVSVLAPPGGAARVLTRRADAEVLVVGCGRLGTTIAVLLAHAGVGRLVLRDEHLATPADAVPGAPAPMPGDPRVIGAAAAVRTASGVAVDVGVHGPTTADCASADVAVVVADRHAAVHPEHVALLDDAELTYLAVGIREACGVVGPLVLPGRTACPRCLDHARADRDPGWAAVAAQIGSGGPRSTDAAGVALTAAVAAVATGQVLAHLGGPGEPSCVDATLELRVPEWTTRRRQWARHPACACARRRELGRAARDGAHAAS